AHDRRGLAHDAHQRRAVFGVHPIGGNKQRHFCQGHFLFHEPAGRNHGHAKGRRGDPVPPPPTLIFRPEKVGLQVSRFFCPAFLCPRFSGPACPPVVCLQSFFSLC